MNSSRIPIVTHHASRITHLASRILVTIAAFVLVIVSVTSASAQPTTCPSDGWMFFTHWNGPFSKTYTVDGCTYTVWYCLGEIQDPIVWQNEGLYIEEIDGDPGCTPTVNRKTVIHDIESALFHDPTSGFTQHPCQGQYSGTLVRTLIAATCWKKLVRQIGWYGEFPLWQCTMTPCTDIGDHYCLERCTLCQGQDAMGNPVESVTGCYFTNWGDGVPDCWTPPGGPMDWEDDQCYDIGCE
jgi:hypothetical protein